MMLGGESFADNKLRSTWPLARHDQQSDLAMVGFTPNRNDRLTSHEMDPTGRYRR